MSQLTQEQRARVEENRLKALAKLQSMVTPERARCADGRAETPAGAKSQSSITSFFSRQPRLDNHHTKIACIPY